MHLAEERGESVTEMAFSLFSVGSYNVFISGELAQRRLIHEWDA